MSGKQHIRIFYCNSITTSLVSHIFYCNSITTSLVSHIRLYFHRIRISGEFLDQNFLLELRVMPVDVQ